MFRMKERDVPYDDSWDVIVVGGGPAGSAAAAASAREGARTLLIEQTGCLGGMGTSGLVPAWTPVTDGEKFVYSGLATRVFKECKKGIAHLKEGDIHGWLPLDPEALKRIYDDLVLGHGAKIMFHTKLAAVEKETDSRISGIIVSRKEGLLALKAKVYVDCTGDGDVAVMAGAEYEKGTPETGGLQPATLCFIVSNADSYGFLTDYASINSVKEGNWMYAGSEIFDIVASGKYPLILDTHICGNLIGPDTIGFNAGHLFDVDNTNTGSVSEAMVTGRKLAKAIQTALSEFKPKVFANSYLASTANLVGARETRRIKGAYSLTVEDYLGRKSFKDEISRNCYKIDIHQTQEEAAAIMSIEGFLNYEKKNETQGKTYLRYRNGESHGIPYRCLTPPGLENLLVAGRCISTDRRVQGSVRVMPVCLSTGEAAGTAAALAVADVRTAEAVTGGADPAPGGGVANVHTVDTDLVRSRLRESGGYLQ